MSDAIVIDDVSKRFRLYHEKFDSLKERVVHFGRSQYEEYWALTDIDFKIQQGETIGLLGHNGSGKSTLLKCIAGILQPTKGEIRVRGRLVALLELGAGFHPDLTGRENVFLNASLLGMPRKEIEKRFDEIVEFAELEQFIDNQVKFYSSGMYVRLGFAVAVNMDPDILLVDEVLAVGDELFQRKCLDRVKQFQRDGRTIVFVTHSADLVRQICDRAAVLDQGKMIELGSPGEAIRSYRERLLERQESIELAHEEAMLLRESADLGDDTAGPISHGQRQERKSTHDIQIKNVTIKYPSDEHSYIKPREGIDIIVDFEATKDISDVAFGIGIYDRSGIDLFGMNTVQLGQDIQVSQGSGRATYRLGSIPLLDGDYLVTISIHTEDGAIVYDWREQKYNFSVMNPDRNVGLVHIPLEVEVTSVEVNA